jgi:hypothetical protein
LDINTKKYNKIKRIFYTEGNEEMIKKESENHFSSEMKLFSIYKITIILSIFSLMIFPNVKADYGTDNTPIGLSLLVLILGIIIVSLIVSIIKSKKKRKMKAIAIAVSSILIVILLISIVTYEPWYDRMQREEDAKPKFGYYYLNEMRNDTLNFSLHQIDAFRIINLDENNIMMVYAHLGNDSYHYLNVVRSNDGNNWSNPIELDRFEYSFRSRYDYSHWGKIVLQKNGDEIFCYYWFLPTTYMADAIFKLAKTTDGENWTDSEVITERIEKAEYNIDLPKKHEDFGWTSVNDYEVHQINNELYFMAIDYEGHGTDTTFERGTFFSFSFDGNDWSDIIKISYVGNIWLPGISIVLLGDEIHIIYFDSDGIVNKIINIDELTNLTGPIYDNDYPVYDTD